MLKFEVQNIKTHIILLNPVKFWIDTVYIGLSLIIGIADHLELCSFPIE